jgi:hypothetical protein
MPFIGNQPAESYSAFQKQDFTTSATTSYTLDHPVANQNEIALFINFVRQEPTTAYTASGTSLTLTSATSSSDDMYCIYLGKAVQTVNPPSGSVGSSQVAASIITGQTALGATPADTDELLISDAGTLKRVDYSYLKTANTPSFYSQMSANQSYSSSGAIVKVQFDTELWDTDGDYDHSTNYRFTPSVAGKYFVHGIVYSATFVNASMAGGAVYIKKNGSNYQGSTGNSSHNTPDFQAVGIPFGIAVDMNGSSDYIECYVQLTFSSGTCNIQHDNNGKASFFGAYKLIGV